MSFRNDGQFPVSDTSLQSILNHYGIESFLYAIATSGIENTTCIIETPKQKYALRVYRQAKKPLDAINRELIFMDMLRSKGLPVPHVFLNQAEQAITQASVGNLQWNALLMEYMSGEHPSSYTYDLLSQMAKAQATMHILGREISQSQAEPELADLVEGEFAHRIDKSTITDERLLRYIDRIEEYKVTLDTGLLCGYSHFDFDKGNILVDRRGHLSAILDFDDLQYAPLVVCLGYALWSVLYKTQDRNLIHRYIAEYQKTRQLSSIEREYLPKIMLFRHYAITALKILNGHTTKEDVQRYEMLEATLVSAIATR